MIYSISFTNSASETHNANSCSYTIKLDDIKIASGSKSLANSTSGTTFNGKWSGEVVEGQTIKISTSTGGWIANGSKSLNVIIF